MDWTEGGAVGSLDDLWVQSDPWLDRPPKKDPPSDAEIRRRATLDAEKHLRRIGHVGTVVPSEWMIAERMREPAFRLSRGTVEEEDAYSARLEREAAEIEAYDAARAVKRCGVCQSMQEDGDSDSYNGSCYCSDASV